MRCLRSSSLLRAWTCPCGPENGRETGFFLSGRIPPQAMGSS